MKMESVAILSLCFTAALAQILSVVNEPESGNGYRMGTDYTLQCQGSLGAGCSIQWDRNEIQLEYTSDTIQVTAEPGQANFRCKFLCNSGQSERISNTINLSGQNLIRVEVLNSGVSGNDWTPLENSVLEFTCDYNMLSWEIIKDIEDPIRPTFTWLSNGQEMGNEETLTIVAVPGYDNSIRCKAFYNGEELTSAAVSVQATDEADEPEVVLMREDTRVEPSLFVTGADYTAHCVSKSHSAGATYLWTKDYFTIPHAPASRTLNLDSVEGDGDDGVYRCRMRLQEQDYCSKSSVPIAVQAAGRFCQSEGDCLGDRYTRTCRNERCECASGYEPRGEVCAGMEKLVASAFLIVCSLLFARLLL